MRNKPHYLRRLPEVITAVLCTLSFLPAAWALFHVMPHPAVFALGYKCRYDASNAAMRWARLCLIGFFPGMSSGTWYVWGFLGVPKWYLAKGALSIFALRKRHRVSDALWPADQKDQPVAPRRH